MAITWRRPSWIDVEQNFSIQPRNFGDALLGRDAAWAAWKQMFASPFFGGAVLESVPPIQGQRVVGFGAGVIVSSKFADAQIENPLPDMNSRIVACLHAGHGVLPTRDQVARANAGHGVDVVVLYASCLRNEILSTAEKQDALALLASTFVEWCAGFRIRNVLCDVADEQARSHVESSVVFEKIAEFREEGRTLYRMSRTSVDAVSSSLGNVLFRFTEPVLRLRESDQQLLLAALGGATDMELASELAITFGAIKARWRSTFARIAESMPDLVSDDDNPDEHRGKQKRHRVLAYMRTHPEELRPYLGC